MFISAWNQRNWEAACEIHGVNAGEAMHRALDHVTWDRHLLPAFAPAAECTNAPLAGSPSSGAHGANSFGR
jgi:hypothetical protein